MGEVYAHSELTLYRFNPVAGDFVTVGEFGCLKGGDGVALMLDIAIDRAGNMVGTAAMSEHAVINGRLVSIDKMTGACTVLKTGSYPNSLAFVPVGTVLPDREALVGYVNDSYVQINPDTGLVSTVGNLNAVAAANPWMSSGDIVSIVGGGTYVTIIPRGSVTADPDGDRIAEVNPATGTIIRVIGATGATGLFGLGYWGGIAYGFSSSSLLVKIDLTQRRRHAGPDLGRARRRLLRRRARRRWRRSTWIECRRPLSRDPLPACARGEGIGSHRGADRLFVADQGEDAR